MFLFENIMDYLVLKQEARKQIRIYPDGSKFDGQILYKGHKLGVEIDLLTKIIDYRIERSTNKISFLIYEKVSDVVSHVDTTIWKFSSPDSFEKNIIESWESVQRQMENKFGKFRKILITIVNI